LDDKNYDSLREQAEGLKLLEYVTGEKSLEIPEEPTTPSAKPSSKSSAVK